MFVEPCRLCVLLPVYTTIVPQWILASFLSHPTFFQLANELTHSKGKKLIGHPHVWLLLLILIIYVYKWKRNPPSGKGALLSA